jgi:hypothetical protein
MVAGRCLPSDCRPLIERSMMSRTIRDVSVPLRPISKARLANPRAESPAIDDCDTTNVFETLREDEAVLPGAPRVARDEPGCGAVRCE